jgi:hypothetical protein
MVDMESLGIPDPLQGCIKKDEGWFEGLDNSGLVSNDVPLHFFNLGLKFTYFDAMTLL